MSNLLFSSLNLPKAQLNNLDSMAYLEMTEVQSKCLPLLLEGKDIIAQAKTGSGKTAAFSLAMLEKLTIEDHTTQAMIICPTRELSVQVATEIRKLGRYRQNLKVMVLCGGQSLRSQSESMKHPAHIIVGTPGRLKDHLNKETISLEDMQTVILDEADRMLDMGFIDDIRLILSDTPRNRQTLFFSASYPMEITKLSDEFQNNPSKVIVESQHSSAQIQQKFFRCESEDRLNALGNLIAKNKIQSAVIFCNTKENVNNVYDFLCRKNYSSLALHGDLEQFDRTQALVQFSQKSCSFLVATDVASRGLDIDELPAVINFELPGDPKVYLHRIGRTGRIGNTGIALSILTDREHFKLKVINEFQNSELKAKEISTSRVSTNNTIIPPMKTLLVRGGRKNKIRPGDILGALTAKNGIAGKAVGKIHIYDTFSYVAVETGSADNALYCLKNSQIKGHTFRIKLLSIL